MYIFNAKLEDTELNITRRFEVPDDTGIYELACAVVTLFGFQGYHSININVAGKEYELGGRGDEPSIKKVFKGTKNACVEYDYGDGWQISLKLEKQTDEYCSFIKLLSGTGRGCVEDVGGTEGLENFVHAFAEKNEDYEEMCEWQGIEEYDWEKCYVDKINEKLPNVVSILCMASIYGEDPFEFEEFYEEDEMPKGRTTQKEIKKWFEESFGVRFWSE